MAFLLLMSLALAVFGAIAQVPLALILIGCGGAALFTIALCRT